MLAPALVVLMVLVGLAIGSESRAEFEEGLNGDRPAADDADPASDRPGADGSDTESTADPGTGADGRTDSAEGADGSATDLSAAEAVEVGPEISLEVRGDDGAVGIRLDPGGSDVAFPRTPDGASGLPAELTPDGLPPDSGLRLRSDGTLDVVPLSETEAGDIVIDPAPTNGIDLIRTGGSRIEIRSEPGAPGEAPSITLTEVDAEGARSPLSADGEGSVAVGDGISIQLPTPGGQIPPMDEPTQIAWRWFLLWIASMTVASLVLASYLWRTAPALPFSEVFHPPPEVAVSRFVDFLTVLRMDPDAARAIRLAFQGAEGGFGSLPPRTKSETPFEWHSRVAAEHRHLDAVLGSLCSRFTTARFAPERPTAEDRNAAVDELEQLAYLAGYHESAGRTTLQPVGEPA